MKIKTQIRVEKCKNIFTKSNNRVLNDDNNLNYKNKDLSFSNVKRMKIIMKNVTKIKKEMSKTKINAKKNLKTKIKKNKTL